MEKLIIEAANEGDLTRLTQYSAASWLPYGGAVVRHLLCALRSNYLVRPQSLEPAECMPRGTGSRMS